MLNAGSYLEIFEHVAKLVAEYTRSNVLERTRRKAQICCSRASGVPRREDIGHGEASLAKGLCIGEVSDRKVCERTYEDC